MFECQRYDVAAYLTNLFNIPARDGQTVEDVMLGSKKSRLGPKSVIDVTSFVSQGEPIPCISWWGATKGYGIHQRADLLDVLALRRLHIVERHVKALYAPGLDIQVVIGDLTEIIAKGSDGALGLGFKIASYRNDLESLIRNLGVKVRLVTESSLLRDKGYCTQQYMNAVSKNEDVFSEYYLSRDPEILRKVGWKGEIQWEFYLRRAQTEYPDADEGIHIRKVITYLANTIARRDYKLNPPGIKMSFCPFPTGTDRTLYRNRIEYKSKDSKTSHKTIQPWCGFGVYHHDRSDCEVIGVKEFRATRIPAIDVRINDFKLPVLMGA